MLNAGKTRTRLLRIEALEYLDSDSHHRKFSRDYSFASALSENAALSTSLRTSKRLNEDKVFRRRSSIRLDKSRY